MNRTTKFTCKFSFNKPVDVSLRNYIDHFVKMRHVSRDISKIIDTDSKWKDHCYRGDLGRQGEFYVIPNNDIFLMNELNDSIINYETPPYSVPSLKCHWTISYDGKSLEWDGDSSFDNYIDWLLYLIENFFAPNGYILNGYVEYQGESDGDAGVISIMDNGVSVDYFHDEEETVYDY